MRLATHPGNSESSWHSSTTIRPRFGSGVNRALRGPTITGSSPGARPPPGVVALAGRQARMHQPHLAGKARTEAPHGLRGERDFGHQHDRLPALAQGFGDGAQVDFGLARAGHAVQQVRRLGLSCPAASRRGSKLIPDRLLVGGQGGRLAGQPIPGLPAGRARPRSRPDQTRPSLGQAAQVGQLAAGLGIDPGDVDRHGSLSQKARSAWRRGPARSRRADAFQAWARACCGRQASWTVRTTLGRTVGGGSTGCAEQQAAPDQRLGGRRASPTRGKAASICRPRRGPRCAKASSRRRCRAGQAGAGRQAGLVWPGGRAYRPAG